MTQPEWESYCQMTWSYCWHKMDFNPIKRQCMRLLPNSILRKQVGLVSVNLWKPWILSLTLMSQENKSELFSRNMTGLTRVILTLMIWEKSTDILNKMLIKKLWNWWWKRQTQIEMEKSVSKISMQLWSKTIIEQKIFENLSIIMISYFLFIKFFLIKFRESDSLELKKFKDIEKFQIEIHTF